MSRTVAIKRCALFLAVLACLGSCDFFRGWRKSPAQDIEPADTLAVISPYDSLIQVWADTLEWDWRLLAALIEKESKFNPQAVSPSGAQGLMQLLPRTASHYGCTDPSDPEQNIRAGVRLLLVLEDRYRDLAANRDELTKFTLAAYNAGSGHIQDCINHARHLGLDASFWQNVASAIPSMQNDSVLALGHIKHGEFYGRETISFVKQILATFNRYREL